jgi:hypothetical protein
MRPTPGWEVPRVLAATLDVPDVPDFYFDLLAQVKMECKTHGRLAVLGDAGYSLSPVTGLAPVSRWWAHTRWRAGWHDLAERTALHSCATSRSCATT